MTKGEDFANIIAIGGDAPTVVWVRVGNTRRVALLAWFEPLLDQTIIIEKAATALSSSAEERPGWVLA